MQKITPYLWFDNQVEQAVHFYTSIFQDSQVGEITHLCPEVPGPQGQVIIATFRLAGLDFIALNGGPEFSFTPAISFFVYCQSEAEIDALWASLSEGGTVLIELDSYPFSQKFGWVMDQFGLSWQLSLAGVKQKIVPYLMFTGPQHGKAEQAIRYYTALFENSAINHLQHYGPDMGEPDGTLLLGNFLLAGQEFMAADSGRQHAFNFTPAISLFITCEDQAEVDYFWQQLATGGEESQCGWLVDRYGVSWQVIPTALTQLMSDPDAEKTGRVTRAMLQMQKIDISQLRRAYEQA